MIFNRVLTREEARNVWSEVDSILQANQFHARAIVQSHDAMDQWHIEVDKVNNEWFAISERGHVHEYRGGVTYHRGDVVQRPTSVTDELVGPLQMAFPGEMLIWGQTPSSFRPMLVEKVGKRSLLFTFEHQLDPSMRSTLVIDADLGLATRLMPFNSPYIVLLDVERGRAVERVYRTSFPELEVITPDY